MGQIIFDCRSYCGQDKARYVHQCKQKEGIALDPSKIQKNPGSKATVQIMLNSFWVKFGENVNKPTTTAMDTPAALFQILSDKLNNIHAIRYCTEGKLEIVCSNINDNQLDNGKKCLRGRLHHLLGSSQGVHDHGDMTNELV